MKYFIDTEFIEGKQDTTIPWLILKKRGGGLSIGQPKPTIDLISIGIVAEDGREYYAISKEFNIKEAWNRFQMKQVSGDARNRYPDGIKEYWIRDNVLKPIWEELHLKDLGISHKAKDILQEQMDRLFSYKSLKYLINKYGKTNKQIAEEVKEFCSIGSIISNKGHNVRYYKEFTESVETWVKVESIEHNNPIHYNNKPEFYGYYADYDWVVFCWLFGKMIDLPKGFPMYCIDLKQTLNERANKYVDDNLKEPIVSSDWHSNYCINELKILPNYPKQTNEHNALADAKWNYELYKFLQTL